MADEPGSVTPPDPRPDGDEAAAAGTARDAADESNRAAYLPIGLVFLILGASGLMSDTMRFASFAFLPVGVVFLILAMQGRTDDDGERRAVAPDVDPGAVDDRPRA